MNEETSRRGLNTLAPWSAVVVAFLAAVYGYGVQAQRIDSLENQVNDMRTDNRATALTLTKIERSTTVIETKLEILLPTKETRR